VCVLGQFCFRVKTFYGDVRTRCHAFRITAGPSTEVKRPDQRSSVKHRGQASCAEVKRPEQRSSVKNRGQASQAEDKRHEQRSSAPIRGEASRTEVKRHKQRTSVMSRGQASRTEVNSHSRDGSPPSAQESPQRKELLLSEEQGFSPAMNHEEDGL
jgi:hypothetical protein